jgi:NhaA family Na+:H+ antiporter
VPAAIYAWINWDDPMAIRGWAIPAATDIAFALGILSLLGNRVPSSLKIFLVSLAIFDDLGAIIIIAIFYTADVSLTALAVAAVCLVVLLSLNRRRVTELAPYLFVGLIMWTAVLKSGVHSTLAGVTLAFFIPMRDPARPERSPVRDLEHDLHTVVAFGILPIFAFANAGISLAGIGMDALLHTVPLGIIAGLVIGKQVGIVGFAGLAILLGWARLPRDAGWMGLYGTALLCGVGFTMSLFIGSLAFPEADATLLFDERVGIILGSLMSGLAGYFVLRSLPRPKAQ